MENNELNVNKEEEIKDYQDAIKILKENNVSISREEMLKKYE